MSDAATLELVVERIKILNAIEADAARGWEKVGGVLRTSTTSTDTATAVSVATCPVTNPEAAFLPFGGCGVSHTGHVEGLTEAKCSF